MKWIEIVGEIASPIIKRHGRLCCWLPTFVAALLLPMQAALAASPAQASPPFLMGTDQEEASLMGRSYRRVFGEAFRRLGVPLTVVVSPTARLTKMADEGEVHGQPTRFFAYAEAHPNQLRVEEPIHEVRLALYAYGSPAKAGHPKRLEDLANGNWLVEYRRGVAICEKALRPLLPAARLSDVTGTDQGLKKLIAGRTDLYCEIDLAVLTTLLTPEFKGSTGIRPVLDLGAALPLYPYIHKSRAELVPRLAEILKKMKAEGLLERYFRESQRELEALR